MSLKFSNGAFGNGSEFELSLNGNGVKHGHGHDDHQNGHHNKSTKNGHHNEDKNGSGSHLMKGAPLSKLGNITNPYTHEILLESAEYIKERTKLRPKIGIICGTGLGNLADTIVDRVVFPYETIPHFPSSTVQGHAGQLVIGRLANVPVLAMQGRFHYYEGYPLWKCAMPIRVFKLLGIEALIVTNAAGGLDPKYSVGDIMIIKDHINFPGFGGESPLRGPNDECFGTRFPPLNSAYDSSLRMLAKAIAIEVGIGEYAHEGVYTMVGGPSFETVAELRAMRILGIDAVGMSTIPEVITAVHCGIKCLAFSLITNACITEYDGREEASHEEVLETALARQDDLKNFVTTLIPHMEQLLNE